MSCGRIACACDGSCRASLPGVFTGSFKSWGLTFTWPNGLTLTRTEGGHWHGAALEEIKHQLITEGWQPPQEAKP